jgi:hypothetical protein
LAIRISRLRTIEPLHEFTPDRWAAWHLREYDSCIRCDKENIVDISSVTNAYANYQPQKPAKPPAPTPPPGGNIENRQPPAEPSKPSIPFHASGTAAATGRTINVYA